MPKMLGPIMNLSLRTILLCLALFANPASATSDSPFGQEPKDVLASSSNNTVNTFSSGPEFVPVEQAYQFSLVVEPQQLVFNWEIRDGYYLYRDRFNFRSFYSNLELQAPIFDSGLVKWDEFFEKDLEVYYSQTTVRLPFTATDDILHLQIESQGCADAGLCYPPYKQWLEIDLQTGAVDISTQPPEQMQDIKETISLPVVLLFALLGGIILNLMPCVFPILSIKVLSFTATHQSIRSRHIHGLVYTAGVVLSFVAIAVLMLALRAAGESIGWGFQLQSPLFVIFLVYLFFVMGLGLSGYLEIGSNLMSLGQLSKHQEGITASFMTGVLAAVIASPCTAPFMGPALGFAISQPTYVALLVFAFLGLGMALPFILLAWIPGLSKRLPRPGAWMDTFKQFLAFPLYITAVWLLWVAGRQTSVDVAAAVVIGLVLLVMGLWLWKLSARPLSKLIAVAIIGAAVTAPITILSEDTNKPAYQAYSPERLATLRASGKPVFINLTADWCITCLVNERVALSSNEVTQLMDDQGIVYLKGDWTNNDPQITALLNKFQRNGVPLYLVYPRGTGAAKILPQILSESIMIGALTQATK
jgi:thiol:disulfide interchange protein